MQGHLRSILPQQGGVAPVDNNTVALFRYKEHTKDAITGVSTIGHREALEFKSVADKITLPPLIPGDEFSIACWIYAHSLSETEHNIAAQYASGDAGRALFTINQSTGMRLRAFIGGQFFFGGTVIQSNRWYHVAMIKKTDGTGVLYLDGAQDGAGALNNNPIPKVNFEIGHGAGRFFDGLIYDFYLYNKALSDIEVKEVTKGQGGKANALIGKWDLSEGNGSIARDLSSSGNDGIISGGKWVEGRAAYSLVKDTPRNGGVLVEEGTTNEFSYPTFDTATNTGGWSHWAPTTAGAYGQTTDASYIYTPGQQYAHWVEAAIDDRYLVYQRPAYAGGVRSLQAIVCMSDGSPVTNANFYPDWNASNGTVEIGNWTSIEQLGNSKFYLCKVEGFSQDGTNDLVGIYVAAGYKAYITHMQVEQKAYATSFINGARGVGKLHYNIAPISAPITCSFWFKREAGNFTSQLINLVDDSGEWRVWLDYGSDMSFSVAHVTGTGTTSYGRVDGGVISSDWTFIAFVISEAELTLYQNGELVGASAHGGTFPAFSKVTVGCHIVSAQPPINGVFDELRIDKVARTETEIQAWYYQGRNGW